jgi:hypothetical protein
MNKTHVDLSLDKVRAIFEKASTIIEAIPKGQKIPATTLAENLAKDIGMTGPQLYPTLKILIDDYPNRIIKRGAHGGIYNPTDEERAKMAAEKAAKEAAK